MPDLDPRAARIVLVTHPTDGAGAFAERLVRRRLVACANLVPVTSVYRWQGEVQQDGETLLVLKTRAEHLDALERVLAQEHPYDVPELVALAPEHVEARYLAWLVGETGPGPA